MDVDKVPGLAQAASMLGPDFYAILMMLVVTATSATLLMGAHRRTPKLTETEIKPFRQFFALSWKLSFVIVFISIAYWIYKQNNIHVVQITIADLPANVQIDSRYYNKTSYRLSRIGNKQLSDHHFLVVKNAPFEEGETFEFSVFVLDKNNGATGGLGEDVTVSFSGEKLYSYKIDLDANKVPKLKPIAMEQYRKPFTNREIMLAQAFTKGGW